MDQPTEPSPQNPADRPDTVRRVWAAPELTILTLAGTAVGYSGSGADNVIYS